MGYSLDIAVRHLRAQKKRSLSVVTWLAVIGVALGVMALVGGFSITTGFEQAFREKVLGVTAHVFVREYGIRFADYKAVGDTIEQVPGVVGSSPMSLNEAMFTGKKGTAGAVVKGIVPERAAKVLAIPEYMEGGSLEALGQPGAIPGVVLGAELADKIGAGVGDVVTLVSPLKSADPNQWSGQPDSPTSRPYKVVGVFRAGFHEYDLRLAYMELSAAQDFFGLGDVVFGLEVGLEDPLQSGPVSVAIEQALERPDYSVMDWRRQNRNLFASLTYQRIAILVVLSVMVVLASCNVACMLIMLVLERTRDIAILKAMGAPNRGILWIFVLEGAAIGAIGTGIGIVLAYAFCEGLLSNGIALDPQVYGIARLPVVFDVWDYVMAAAGAMVITFVAAIFPALRGAHLHPVEGFRAGG